MLAGVAIGVLDWVQSLSRCLFGRGCETEAAYGSGSGGFVKGGVFLWEGWSPGPPVWGGVGVTRGRLRGGGQDGLMGCKGTTATVEVGVVVGGGGAYSFVACLSSLTMDHAFLSARSTVHTPNRDTSNIWALSTFLPCAT